MQGSKQKGQPAPPPDAAAATPFFARFLEDQHGGDARPKAPQAKTLKYPSDRDEWDDHSSDYAEAAPVEAAPSRMTLKYPSDRDEIDLHSTLHGGAADAR